MPTATTATCSARSTSVRYSRSPTSHRRISRGALPTGCGRSSDCRQLRDPTRLFEEFAFDEYRRLDAVLLAAAGDRLPLGIEAAAGSLLVHGAEADHHQRLGAFVAERIKGAPRQHQGLVLLQYRQLAVEAGELRLALQHHENVVLVDMGMQTVLTALWTIAMDVERHRVGLREQILGVTGADELGAQPQDFRFDH